MSIRALPNKVLPHSSVAEASVLGGILCRNSILDELDTLEPAAFFELKHRVVFAAMRNLQAAGTPIDTTTLEVEIERQGKLEAIGGVGILGEIALIMPTVDHALHYAKIVRGHHLVREVALKASRAVDRAYDWDHDPDELLGETLADLQQLERGYREASDHIPVITIDDSLRELAELARTPVFETPFPALNQLLGFGGLLGGQLYYLAGGTGFGKTSFIATLVRHHAELDRPAVIAFYEMFAGYYTARMSSALLGVHANRIIRGEVDHDAIRRALPTTRIEMLDAPSMVTLRRLAERHVKAGHGAPLIVVDYAQLLGERIMATMARPDPRIAMSMASGGLRELAKETGAAIICVSAAGRSASKELMKDVRKHPARDLVAASRESGSIEFDGAGLIVLSVSDEKEGDENIATISIAKARFGETSHIDARYAGATGAWRSLARHTKIVDLNAKPDDGSLRAAIVAALAASKRPLSKTAITKATKKNKTAICSEIDAMSDVGIVRAATGGYVLVSAVSEPVPEPLPGLLQAAINEVQP